VLWASHWETTLKKDEKPFLEQIFYPAHIFPSEHLYLPFPNLLAFCTLKVEVRRKVVGSRRDEVNFFNLPYSSVRTRP
jgi:hypothetical protein